MVSSRNGALSSRFYRVHRRSVHRTYQIPLSISYEHSYSYRDTRFPWRSDLRVLHHAEMPRLVQLPQESPHPTFRHSTTIQVIGGDLQLCVLGYTDRCPLRLSHVPLTLLYSSLSKLFLLFLLSIWRPSTTNSTQIFTERAKGTILAHPIINSALEILDDDKLDKEWVIRNVLGGMAAGFGLRGIYIQIPFCVWILILSLR